MNSNLNVNITSFNNYNCIQNFFLIEHIYKQINNCSALLPDVQLNFIYNDTQGLVHKSSGILVDHICNDIAAFIGPEGPSCNVEAMLAASKNRAMISYR